MATETTDAPETPPTPPTATLTFAEWCDADKELKAADEAAFDEHMKPPEPDPQAAPEPPKGSAFATYYGPSAEQKMDRATLDARVKTMNDALKAKADAAAAAAPHEEHNRRRASRTAEAS